MAPYIFIVGLYLCVEEISVQQLVGSYICCYILYVVSVQLLVGPYVCLFTLSSALLCTLIKNFSSYSVVYQLNCWWDSMYCVVYSSTYCRVYV